MALNELLLIAAGVAFMLSAASLFLVMKQRRHIFILERENDKQLHMVSSSVVGIGNRLLDIERRLATVSKDQQVLSDTQQDFSYSKAKKLIEQNIQLEAVAASTGLSLSEVELIKLIHNQNAAVPDTYS